MTAESYRFELEITTRNGEGKTFPLGDGTYVLGRTPECNLYVPDSSISRSHARLTVSGNTITVEDLESLNGTCVAGNRISVPTAVKARDKLTFGDLEAGLVYLSTELRANVEEIWLELLNTSHKGKLFKVTGPRAVIGRSQAADIRINHATLSRSHSVLRYAKDEGGWMVEDQDSANGTYVDGAMVSQAVLSGGEKLRIGDVELAFLGNHRPVPKKRYGLVFILVALLGSSIALLLLDLLGLIIE